MFMKHLEHGVDYNYMVGIDQNGIIDVQSSYLL